MIVGFSGGADSTLLVRVAEGVFPGRVVAVTAVSPSIPASEVEDATALAREIGVRHLLIDSQEMSIEGYAENSPRRCYFCKSELFRILKQQSERLGIPVMAYGAVTDDLGDFRPGMDAAREAGAIAPLLDAGVSKADVREISRHLGLRTWDKPAAACLSSRIPFGTRIDATLLSRVERAEAALRAEGFRQVRVRDHGEIARVECLPGDFERLLDPQRRERVTAAIRAAGFRFVCADLAGYRSGSLNPPPTRG
ncbi:MAG: ATP-dependent sacrificial sulfur transferase LarE [Acidobacteria bacterium]|nr:ATP-dependent sacrificial sulfur transferase LarE [Acidobacteriota bacterium]